MDSRTTQGSRIPYEHRPIVYASEVHEAHELGPFLPHLKPEAWSQKITIVVDKENEAMIKATHTKGQRESFARCKNQARATAAFAEDRKKQVGSVAALQAKLAAHKLLEGKRLKKCQLIKEKIQLAKAGGIPKGFEEYPLYGGGDDEVKEAIIEKLWDDKYALLVLADRMNAYREKLERDTKTASKRISLRYFTIQPVSHTHTNSVAFL